MRLALISWLLAVPAFAEEVVAGRNTPRSVTTLNWVASAHSEAARTADSAILPARPASSDLR